MPFQKRPEGPKRLYAIRIEEHQWQWLRKQQNASQAIRDFIDGRIAKEGLK